jgi:PKD repeat protein
VPPDAADPQNAPRVDLWSVAFGGFSLVIGDRRGALIDDRADGDDTPADEEGPRADGQHAASQTRAATLERAVARASSATDKLEQVVNFIARLLQTKLDVDSLHDDAEHLIGMAQRDSHDKRWDEVLEVARALAMLLALLERWDELLQSLQLSIHAAEQLGDVAAEAWGHHELGTVHLLRGDHAKADSSLVVARKLREQIGDWDGLAATDFNLQVLCHGLRAGLHEPAHGGGHPLPPRRPLATLGFAVLMLVVGGAAGVAIGHTSSLKETSGHPASVGIELTPDIPRAEQPVAFRAVLDGHAPASGYDWQFGDGSRSSLASPTHFYQRPGRYVAMVTIAKVAADSTQISRGARTVIVAGVKPNESVQRSITPNSIRIVSATPNPVPAGAEASKIAVKVLNQEGEVISGQPVTFTVRPRDGALSASSVRSDSDGIADATLILTGSRTSTVKDTVEACATARACNTVNLEWQPQITPIVVTLAASAVTATGATLNGTLNPNDAAIKSCYFQFGIGSYEHSAQCSSQRTEGASPIHVSASHLSLTPNSIYSFRLVAGNASGQSSGEAQAFKTLETEGKTTGPTKPIGEKPTVMWLNESTSEEGERLEGSVNPNGSEIEACYFEFEVGEVREERPCSPLRVGSGTKAVTVTAVISSKASHFRLVAKNAGGAGEAGPPTFG